MPLLRSRGFRTAASDALPQSTLQTISRKRRAVFIVCTALVVTVLLVSASSWHGAEINSWPRQLLQSLTTNRTSISQSQPKLNFDTQAVLDRICNTHKDPEPDPRKQNPTQCAPIAEVLDAEGHHDNGLLAQQLGQHPDECGALLQMPKVALMFLTRGPMPHEELWNRWLASAAGLVAVDCTSSSVCSPTLLSNTNGSSTSSKAQAQPSRSALKQACTLKRTAENGYLQQHMFSIYIHPPPDFGGYDPSSVFHRRELPTSERLVTKWGHHSTTEVTRRMIKAALQDPLNQRFVQLSESCIPMYPPAMVHQQLTLDPVSRIGACIKEGFDRNVKRLSLLCTALPSMCPSRCSFCVACWHQHRKLCSYRKSTKAGHPNIMPPSSHILHKASSACHAPLTYADISREPGKSHLSPCLCPARCFCSLSTLISTTGSSSMCD